MFPQRSTFEKRQLSAPFYSEGSVIGDIDRDGFKNIINGPYWYSEKRVWTRGPQEGWEPDEHAVVYYFERRIDNRSSLFSTFYH